MRMVGDNRVIKAISQCEEAVSVFSAKYDITNFVFSNKLMIIHVLSTWYSILNERMQQTTSKQDQRQGYTSHNWRQRRVTGWLLETQRQSGEPLSPPPPCPSVYPSPTPPQSLTPWIGETSMIRWPAWWKRWPYQPINSRQIKCTTKVYVSYLLFTGYGNTISLP